jgi:hypothetical protein
MENSYELGNNNWAVKSGSLLGYRYDSVYNKWFSRETSFTRASTATRVNASGLIESVASGIPRIDYSQGSSALLLEPQRTNLITFSEDFAPPQANYNNASVLANTDISPDGTLTADKVTFNGNFSAVRKNFTYLAGTTYTISFYAKRVSGVDSFIMFDSTNSVTIATFNFTNEWVRYTVTFTPAITSTLVYWVRIEGGSTSANTFLIWGAQVEVGSNATSYIPTLSTSVTRLADVASKTGISSLVGQTEGSVFAEFSTKNILSENKRILGLKSPNNQNRIALRIINNGMVGVEVFSSNSRIYGENVSIGLQNNQFCKILVKYNNSQIKLFANGSLLLQSGVINFSPNELISILALGISETNLVTENIDGNIKEAIIFPIVLTDQECINLTTL